MKPSVGRIVHLVDTGIDGACRAAIVIEAYTEPDRVDVDLVVFEPPAGQSGGPLPGPVSWYLGIKPGGDINGQFGDGWHWPERVEE